MSDVLRLAIWYTAVRDFKNLREFGYKISPVEINRQHYQAIGSAEKDIAEGRLESFGMISAVAENAAYLVDERNESFQLLNVIPAPYAQAPIRGSIVLKNLRDNPKQILTSTLSDEQWSQFCEQFWSKYNLRRNTPKRRGMVFGESDAKK